MSPQTWAMCLVVISFIICVVLIGSAITGGVFIIIQSSPYQQAGNGTFYFVLMIFFLFPVICLCTMPSPETMRLAFGRDPFIRTGDTSQVRTSTSLSSNTQPTIV